MVGGRGNIRLPAGWYNMIAITRPELCISLLCRISWHMWLMHGCILCLVGDPYTLCSALICKLFFFVRAHFHFRVCVPILTDCLGCIPKNQRAVSASAFTSSWFRGGVFTKLSLSRKQPCLYPKKIKRITISCLPAVSLVGLSVFAPLVSGCYFKVHFTWLKSHHTPSLSLK